jgi:hypothetical protein
VVHCGCGMEVLLYLDHRVSSAVIHTAKLRVLVIIETYRLVGINVWFDLFRPLRLRIDGVGLRRISHSHCADDMVAGELAVRKVGKVNTPRTSQAGLAAK